MSQIARSPSQIGWQIQQHRKVQKLTQTDLASLAGLRQEMVSKIETGQPGSRLSSIFSLLSALGLEMSIAPRTRNSSADIRDIF